MTEAAITAICAEINEALAACVAANVSALYRAHMILVLNADNFKLFLD